MEPVEYVFRIDIFTPETIAMARLAEYLTELAKLVGHVDHTHFVKLEAGSTRIVHRVDAVDAPKVEARLAEIAGGGGPRDAVKAREALDQLLANDNAVGQLLRADGGIVIPFPGRLRPKPLTFPAFRQDGSIDGQVVSVGGRDATAHVILQDGPIVYSGCSLDRDKARSLARLLYGPKVRLIGNGRWERHPDGAWKLLDFKVDRFEVLDDRPLDEILRDLRDLPSNGLLSESAYRDVMDLRSEDGSLH